MMWIIRNKTRYVSLETALDCAGMRNARSHQKDAYMQTVDIPTFASINCALKERKNTDSNSHDL
jgi:hypothetical protein